MIASLHWTCRSSSAAQDQQEKYSVGYSSNSYGEAVANESADWNSKSYSSSSNLEEKPISRVATEVGEYPFWSYASTDPGEEGYVPASSYISLVKYGSSPGLGLTSLPS